MALRSHVDERPAEIPMRPVELATCIVHGRLPHSNLMALGPVRGHPGCRQQSKQLLLYKHANIGLSALLAFPGRGDRRVC